MTTLFSKRDWICLAIFGVLSVPLGTIVISCSNTSNTSERSSLQETRNVYDDEIDKLEALVNDIVRLEYQYIETHDESIAERGEELCAQLRDMSYTIEKYQKEGKLSVVQMDRINQILEKLPQ